jgi:hypothetical protein
MYDTVLEHVTAFYLQSTDFNGKRPDPAVQFNTHA